MQIFFLLILHYLVMYAVLCLDAFCIFGFVLWNRRDNMNSLLDTLASKPQKQKGQTCVVTGEVMLQGSHSFITASVFK